MLRRKYKLFCLFLTQHTGFLGPIAKVLGWILNILFEFLQKFGIENAGLCIILFTFIVRTLMIPLTIKQQKFSKMSSKMNPELTAIQTKYKGKKDEASLRRQQAEIQAVYQKYGASPTSGCLPMLITFPLMFALYRVIYNIPAYVDGIYVLYQNIANQIQGIDGYAKIMADYANQLNVVGFHKWGDISKQISVNHIIDILSGFKTTDWISLKQSFPTISNIITENSTKIIHINQFFGNLNISNRPGMMWPGVLIPIFAMVFQFIQGKQMEVQTPMDDQNPAAGTMKTMNLVMPIMSGFFCISLPIGVGLYWVSGSIFQIIQQFFVNKYLEKIDVDELIEKNIEKKGYRNKLNQNYYGEEPQKTMRDFANIQTKSVKEISNESICQPGGIAEKANILKKDGISKGEK